MMVASLALPIALFAIASAISHRSINDDADREIERTLDVAHEHALKVFETIDRSLAKGRTIELHKEDFSDIGTFKGTMTSVGCGLLLAGLIAVLGLGVVEAVARRLGFPGVADALRFWPYWLAGLLVVFLVLQLVLKLAAPAESDQRAQRKGS